MATHISKTVSWQAGVGSPIKYTFNLDADVEVVSVTQLGIATIHLWGTVGVQNNPTNSRNSFQASDFAVLGAGAMNLQFQHQFTPGVVYYQSALPCIPDGDQATINKVLIQFRGDTWLYDPVNNNNRSSLWTKQHGYLLNTYDGSIYQSFRIDMTYAVDVSQEGDVPILTWTTSGSTGADYTAWIAEQTWLSWFELDYRPGERKVGVWRSHNRPAGVADRKGYGTMRTSKGGVGTNDPPSRKTSGTWYNQKRIGQE